MVRIQKILCPVDFFPASEHAAEYAIALAKRYKARIILLHVVTPVILSPYEIPMDIAGLTDAMRQRAREELAKLAKRAEAEGVKVEALVRIGEVDLSIRSVVKARKADFIVMGTHGRRGLERFFIGSVTARMLRRSSVPLLTIGTTTRANVAPPKIRQILVTTDFSDGTADAVSYAFSIARVCGAARVTLLHVLNDVDADISGRYRDQLIRTIRYELEKLAPADARNRRLFTARVESGRPIHRILPIIKNEEIDLLVMNVHGKTLLDRVMIGSTAERVVREARTPVLVVPPLPGVKRRRRVSSKTPSA